MFKENRGSASSSTAIAELNAENCVKIGPVDVEIIGLTKIIYIRKSTNPENFANIGGIHSEIIGLESIVKTGMVSAVRVIQGH